MCIANYDIGCAIGNDVDICCGQKTNIISFTCSTTSVLYPLRKNFDIPGMQASRPPTSFWDSVTNTVHLLFNTPLVEPELPKRHMIIPLKALPALHTPFSRGTVPDDLESASDPPVSTTHLYPYSITDVIITECQILYVWFKHQWTILYFIIFNLTIIFLMVSSSHHFYLRG